MGTVATLKVFNAISNGGLTDTGPGTLNLLGDNVYTGSTEIQSGALLLGTTGGSGSSNFLSDLSPVSIADGARFDVNGYSETIGSLTGTGSVSLGSGTLAIAAGGSVNPGGDTVNTLTINGTGTLLASGATLNVDLNGFPRSDVLQNNAGVLDLAGVMLQVSAGSISDPGQTFTIVNSPAGISGSFSGLPDGTTFSAANGHQYTVHYTSTQATLTDAAPIPANLVVDNITDENAGDISPGHLSLREAIAVANANPDASTITFEPGLTGTITLSLGELNITNDTTITGLGANLLTINANHTSGVFNVNDDDSNAVKTVVLDGMTSTGGNGTPGGAFATVGGGIFNTENLTLQNSTVSGNSADGGGGLYNRGGTVTLQNSTVSGNSGGGLYNPSFSKLLPWQPCRGWLVTDLSTALNLGWCHLEITNESQANFGISEVAGMASEPKD